MANAAQEPQASAAARPNAFHGGGVDFAPASTSSITRPFARGCLRRRAPAPDPIEVRGADIRLLTLIGPGGVGKTQLGIQDAADLGDDFPDGVYFVDRAPIRDSNTCVASRRFRRHRWRCRQLCRAHWAIGMLGCREPTTAWAKRQWVRAEFTREK